MTTYAKYLSKTNEDCIINFDKTRIYRVKYSRYIGFDLTKSSRTIIDRKLNVDGSIRITERHYATKNKKV